MNNSRVRWMPARFSAVTKRLQSVGTRERVAGELDARQNFYGQKYGAAICEGQDLKPTNLPTGNRKVSLLHRNPRCAMAEIQFSCDLRQNLFRLTTGGKIATTSHHTHTSKEHALSRYEGSSHIHASYIMYSPEAS